MGFELVTRRKSKLRLAMVGPSGSGKTLSALLLAYGITNDWGKIALIDTEHERGRFYAGRQDYNTGEFLYQAFYPPYSPERYEQMVTDGAAAVGNDGVVIIDSFSHAWSNEGGVLDRKGEIAKKQGKNDYTAWDDAGKLQNKLVNTILAVPCHTIVTMRTKMAYAMEINDRGKQVPVKIGLAPIQRDDTEYEFDIVLQLSREHYATASKDTTFLDDYNGIITPELGKSLKDWLDDGKEPERCDDCAKIITPAPNATVTDIIAGTTATYGRKLCMNCARKAKENADASTVSN